MTVISSERRAARAAPTAVNWLASPFLFWGVLALYLAAHIALRLWSLGDAELRRRVTAKAG